MPAPGVSIAAGGNVRQSRFVKLNGTDNTATECSTGEQVFGVSGRGSRNAPYSTLDDGYLAISGEAFRVHGPTETCLLVAGAAVNAGDRLKSDSAGRGVAVASNNDQYGAVALQDASAAGVEILVRVEVGQYGA